MAQATWSSQQSEKFRDERSKPFFDLMNLVVKEPSMSIIDLGCGSGELTTRLHRDLNAKSTLGVDSSDDMLLQAKGLEKDSVLDSGLRFSKGEIEKFKPKEKFDLVFSNAALQCFDDHEDIFEKIRALLTIRGQVAIQMPMNQDYPTHTVAREMAAEISPDFKIQDSMLSLGEYASILYRLGFKEQNTFVKVCGHELESRDGVIEWVKGSTLTGFKKLLTAKKYESFLKEYERRLFSEIKDERPFFYPYKRVFLWARL